MSTDATDALTCLGGFEREERKSVAPSGHAELENRRDEMVSQ
jgi:hypothetical protein